MELKHKIKVLLIFGIIFIEFVLFNTNTVNAVENVMPNEDVVTMSIKDEINKYKCSIEIEDGENGSYILYNNYFDTKDVTVKDSSHINGYFITINNINQELFNDILESPNDTLLVEVPADTKSVKEGPIELEIIDLNNKKYVEILDTNRLG